MKMSGPFLLLFLVLPLSGGTQSGSVLFTSHIYQESFSTRESAQDFCRRYHIDLAVFDQQFVESDVTMDGYQAWIGAYSRYGADAIFVDRRYNYTADMFQSEVLCGFVDYSTRSFYITSCGNSLFFYCSTQGHPTVTFVPLSKTWFEALLYCRAHYLDLASNQRDVHLVLVTQDFPVWIGLPSNGSLESSGDCVSVSSVGKVKATQDCSDRLPFLCVEENLILVTEEKSWEEALEHCRGLRPAGNLVSVQPGEDHKDKRAKVLKAHAEEVWVGLRFLAGGWFWVDGADVSYPDVPRCPPQWKHCGVLSGKGSSSVEVRDCEERKKFLCSQRGSETSG